MRPFWTVVMYAVSLSLWLIFAWYSFAAHTLLAGGCVVIWLPILVMVLKFPYWAFVEAQIFREVN